MQMKCLAFYISVLRYPMFVSKKKDRVPNKKVGEEKDPSC